MNRITFSFQLSILSLCLLCGCAFHSDNPRDWKNGEVSDRYRQNLGEGLHDAQMPPPPKIVNLTVTNPPIAPKVTVGISWTSPATLLVSTNLIDWAPKSVTVEHLVKQDISAPMEFFKVPMDSANLSVRLAWEASPSPEVVGYNVYYGVASRTYTNMISVGNVTNATITGLDSGVTYYIAATAFDVLGTESDFSNEVTIIFPDVDVTAAIKIF